MNKLILHLWLISLSWGIIFAELNPRDAGFNTKDRNSTISARAVSGVYVTPGYSFDTVASASSGLSSWSSGSGSFYYGMVVTNVATLYTYSYYINSPIVATDRFAAHIFEVDNTFVTRASVWIGYFNMNNVGGSSAAGVNGYQKVTANIGGIALDPSKNYFLSFWAVSTSRSYSYSLSTNVNNNYGSCWSNTNNMGTGVGLSTGGSTFTFEIQSTGIQVAIHTATSVPTTGGVTTIAGIFGPSVVVTIGGKSCPVISSSSSSIQCQAPAGTGANNTVTVVSNSQTVSRNILAYYEECLATGVKLPVLAANQTSFANETLTLTLKIEKSLSRLATEIHIGAASHPACSFPSSYSTSSTAGCVETFVIRLPWALHALCNFEKITNDPDVTVFEASLYVTTTHVAGEMRGRPFNRTQTDILNVAVSFPKRVSVRANIVVTSPVNLQSQVTRQSFDPNTQKGSVTFITSIQWPFILAGPAISSKPAAINVVDSVRDSAEDCSQTNGTVCFQSFNFDVAPNGTCVLDGTYIVNFRVACRGNAQCPFDGTTYNVQATLVLQSADFCASLNSAVTVTSSLTSYHNSSKSLEKTSYVINQYAFFELAVRSPDAPLTNVTLASVTLARQGSPAIEIKAIVGLVSQIKNGVTASSFLLFLNSTYFVVPDDSSATFEIKASADLTFANNERKRTTGELATTEAHSYFTIIGKRSLRSPQPFANSATQHLPLKKDNK